MVRGYRGKFDGYKDVIGLEVPKAIHFSAVQVTLHMTAGSSLQL